MTFEELVVKNVDQMPASHPAHYLEKVIKRELLPKQVIHDIEHGDMLESWGLSRNVDYIKVLSTRDGQFDRFWHICLHLRYWKENNKNTEAVAEFEARFPNVDLNTIPLPTVE